jgi:minor histocompatibility antigen H13
MSTWHIYGCIVVSALIPIHLGAVASVKAPKSVRKQRKDAPDDDEEMERITWSDALLFPLLAAVLLTILFFAFKYFDAAILNKILNAYLSLVGSAGVVRFALYLHPPSNAPKYTLCLSKADKSIFNCKFQLRHLLCISASATFMAAHVWTGHWTLQNAFGLILAFNAISLLCLDSFRAGAVLLAGLFVYDIVMVFYTPMMVRRFLLKDALRHRAGLGGDIV